MREGLAALRQVKPRVNVSLLAIVGEGVLSYLSSGLISFALPLYARHLGLSLSEVGILAALSSTVALTVKPSLGWLADRFGRKRTFLTAMGLRSLASLLFGFAAVPWELFVIRGAQGVSTSLRDPSANALIAEHGGEQSIASAFAWYQTAKTVAGSASRAMAGVLLTVTAGNYALVFFVAFALSVLPVLVVARYVQEERGASRAHDARASAAQPLAQRDDRETSAGPAQHRPKILPFAGLAFLIAGTGEMLNSLFPVLATEYAGLSNAQAGIIYAVSTSVTIVSGPLFGWVSDRLSRKLVLMARTVFNTLSSILYLVAPTFFGFAVAKTVDDMGKGAFRAAWGALMAQVSSFDMRNRARTMSWMSTGEDAGRAFGPLLAGLLWSTWGIHVLLGARVFLAILTEVYTVSITRQPAWHTSPPARLTAEDTVPAGGHSRLYT